MKSTIASTVLVAAILILGSLSILAVPVHAVTTQTLDLSSTINCGANDGRTCTGFWIGYDSVNQYIWQTISQCSNGCYGALYRVSLSTVLTSPSTSVASFVNPIPTVVAPYGSLAGIDGSVLLGGNLWLLSTYSVNAISIAQIDVNDNVLNQWFYGVGLAGSLSGSRILTDGISLFAAVSGTVNGILKMTQSGTFSILASTSCGVVDMQISGSVIHFSEASCGIGQVNTDGSGLVQSGCGGCSLAAFVSPIGANTWFTDSGAGKIVKYNGSTFTPYPTGIASGLSGLIYDSVNNGIWLDGSSSHIIRFFSLATLAIDSTKDITTTKEPSMGLVDTLGRVWNLATGSSDFIVILPSAPQTTTTTTTTNASTTTTTSVGAASYNPQVIPTITINSTGLGGQHNIYLAHNNSVTLTGFEWFYVSGSGGTFNSLGICDTAKSCQQFGYYPSPSTGTFQSLNWTTPPTIEGPQPACTIVPYLPFCHLAYAPVNVIQTSATKTGIFCNNAYIVNTVAQCNGNGNPISYQTFRITVNNLPLGETTISLQAAGTASNGQVSIENIFVFNVGT